MSRKEVEIICWFYYLIVFSISLHGSNVDLVAGVENIHLPEDAGHVAELAHVLLHQVLELLFEAVIELEGIIGLSLLESSLLKRCDEIEKYMTKFLLP